MKVNLIILTILFTVIIMSGCAPRYSCKEVIPGTRCASLSEVYNEQVTGLEISKDTEKVPAEETAIQKKQGKVVHKAALLVSSSEKTGQHRDLNNVEIVKGLKNSRHMPILRPPKIVRIWIAPWVDGNEDLNMDTYIYTEISGKKWILGEKMPNSGGSDTVSKNIGSIINTLE
jgi:conjugal transfer pilus assembly protein TraV